MTRHYLIYLPPSPTDPPDRTMVTLKVKSHILAKTSYYLVAPRERLRTLMNYHEWQVASATSDLQSAVLAARSASGRPSGPTRTTPALPCLSTQFQMLKLHRMIHVNKNRYKLT